jgi:glycogen operon protein
MHAGSEPVDVTLPGAEFGTTFEPTLDTTEPDGAPASDEPLPARATVTLAGRSLLLLKAPREQ